MGNRDTKSVEKFQDITHRILTLMFDEIFDYHLSDDRHWKTIEAVSPLEITYGSLMCQRGIYGVCLNDSCQNALENTLHSFQPIIRSVIGTLKVEEKFIEDRDGVIRSNRQAVALMPKDIDQRIVIIFADTISQKNSNNEYKKLVKGLCLEKNVPLIDVPDNKALGEWAGLCKIDKDGNPRKVVGASCVCVTDFGEEGQAYEYMMNFLNKS